MKKSILSLMILLALSVSCSSIKMNESLRIEYKTLKNNDCKKDYRKGNVAIYFTEGFNNDSISIYNNDTVIKEFRLTSDPSSGLAGYIELGSINQFNEIGFRINKSELKSIKCDTVNQLFLISKSKKIMIIESVCYFPRFY